MRASRGFSLAEAVMAAALTALLVSLALAVFLPLARAGRRYHRRSDQQQQTEQALERMTHMIENSKASGIRIYEYRPDSTYTRVLQTQAVRDVGPEARTIWEGKVEFLSWRQGELRYRQTPAPTIPGDYPGLRVYNPPVDNKQFRELMNSTSTLICSRLARWEIQGFSTQGIHFPLILIVETINPAQAGEPAYSYTLRTSARPIIRHGL